MQNNNNLIYPKSTVYNIMSLNVSIKLVLSFSSIIYVSVPDTLSALHYPPRLVFH